MISRRKQWDRLNQMVDEAIDGTFRESSYDETELSRLEVKWKQFLGNSSMSREQIEREKENIKSLISDISHQTKTPVANIKLYEELLMEKLEERGHTEELELLAQICRHTEKLEFFIQSLTRMSQLENGIITLHPEPEKVSGLLRYVQQEIAGKAEKKGIRVRVMSPEDFSVLCDRKWTEEAVCNLVDNAVKYSPQGSEIVIVAKKYEMYGAVTVQDEGMGIAESEIPKVFHRFYRGSQTAQEEGVGLGLYLAREIVRRQNGYIKVKSEPGHGSEFSVFLPRM